MSEVRAMIVRYRDHPGIRQTDWSAFCWRPQFTEEDGPLRPCVPDDEVRPRSWAVSMTLLGEPTKAGMATPADECRRVGAPRPGGGEHSFPVDRDGWNDEIEGGRSHRQGPLTCRERSGARRASRPVWRPSSFVVGVALSAPRRSRRSGRCRGPPAVVPRRSVRDRRRTRRTCRARCVRAQSGCAPARCARSR